MHSWEAPRKPAELAEHRLLKAILEGRFPAGSHLPPERELASRLGVTRPTLREALQRLARDGWLEIRQGRPTRVREFWIEGNLGVVRTLASYPEFAPSDFTSHLLEVRRWMAPAYTRLAIERQGVKVATLLASTLHVPEDALEFTLLDWKVQFHLAQSSGNTLFTLILNSFSEASIAFGQTYFAHPSAREHAHAYYLQLQDCAIRGDAPEAEALTARFMMEALEIWKEGRQERSA